MSPSKEGVGSSSKGRIAPPDRVYVEIPRISQQKRFEYEMFSHMSSPQMLKASPMRKKRPIKILTRSTAASDDDDLAIFERGFYAAPPPKRGPSFLSQTSSGTRELSYSTDSSTSISAQRRPEPRLSLLPVTPTRVRTNSPPSQSFTTPRPRPKKRVVPVVKILNLGEVLNDPEWHAVRTQYLLRRQAEATAAARSLEKGKGKAAEYDDEEDEEEQVYAALQLARSPVGSDTSEPSSSRKTSVHISSSTPRERRRSRKGAMAYSQLVGSNPLQEEFWLSGDDDEEDLYQPSEEERPSQRRNPRIVISTTVSEAEEPGKDGRHDFTSEISLGDLELGESSTDLFCSPSGASNAPLPKSPSKSTSKRTPKRGPSGAKEPSKKTGRPRKAEPTTAKPYNRQVKDLAIKRPPGAPGVTDDNIYSSAVSLPPRMKPLVRASSVFRWRRFQRPMTVLTSAQLDAIQNLRDEGQTFCHMCHQKKVTMKCNSCTSNFCDACLSKFPLPFEPLVKFKCPKCRKFCICGGCIGRNEPDSVYPVGTLGEHVHKTYKQFLRNSGVLKKLMSVINGMQGTVHHVEDIADQVPTAPAAPRTSGTSSLSPAPSTPHISTSPNTFAPHDKGSPLASPMATADYHSYLKELTPPLLEDDFLSSTSLVPTAQAPILPISPTSSTSSLDVESYFDIETKRVDSKNGNQQPLEASCLLNLPHWETKYRMARWRYGFVELDPHVAIPGQTWVGDVGMFAFDADTPTPPPCEEQGEGSAVQPGGISLDELELHTVDVDYHYSISSSEADDAEEGEREDEEMGDVDQMTITPSNSTSTMVPDEYEDPGEGKPHEGSESFDSHIPTHDDEPPPPPPLPIVGEEMIARALAAVMINVHGASAILLA